MANVCHYKIVYDDKDDLALKFIDLVHKHTNSWGFKDKDEELGGDSLFYQLHDDLENINVIMVVILPKHDDERTMANHASQEALLKAIKNKEKCVIPICLNGGKSKLFNLYPRLEFKEEADWKKQEKWDKLKKALEDRCLPVSTKHADRTKASPTPDDSSNFITDKLFCDISEKIGNGWWKLGIRLRLESIIISEIENSNRGQSRDMIIDMLRKWKQSFDSDSDEERVNVLCRTLRAEKRNDLAKDIEDRYADFSQSSSPLKTNPTEIDKSITNDVFLLEVAGKLPDDWLRICLLLGVGNEKLQCLKHDYGGSTHRQAFQALVIWRCEAGDLSNEAKMDQLLGVFEQSRRKDIVEWIEADPVETAKGATESESFKEVDDKTIKIASNNAIKSESGVQEASLQHETKSDSPKQANGVRGSMEALNI